MFLHLSVILFTGGRCTSPLGRHPPGQTSPLGIHPPWVDPPRDGHCSGRYASYWNAFLFSLVLMYLNSFSSKRNSIMLDIYPVVIPENYLMQRRCITMACLTSSQSRDVLMIQLLQNLTESNIISEEGDMV